MTQQRTLKVERLGLVEYCAALEIQKQTERAVLTSEQPDTLLLLEHPHTLTLGRRSAQNGIMAPEEILKARGVSVFETNRGGKVTYHGLGQIVGYPIIERFAEVFEMEIDGHRGAETQRIKQKEPTIVSV